MASSETEGTSAVKKQNISRWIILISSSILLLYGFVPFIGALIAYSKGSEQTIMITIVNKDILSAMLCASTLIVVTGIIGIFAVQRKDRSLLACHTLLLWPCLALLASVAYLSYRDTTWDMKTILGMKWRYDLTPEEQFQLQETLHCCGFENSSDHALYKPSSNCSPESLLQGCHEKLNNFESYFLVKTYSTCFGLVPIHILFIITALSYSRPSSLSSWLPSTANTDISAVIHHSPACNNYSTRDNKKPCCAACES